MTDPAPVERRSTIPPVPLTQGGGAGVRPAWTAPALSDPADLEELVDLVVARIEQRVVDELERRGRRGTAGI
jgi:hypothetical protein